MSMKIGSRACDEDKHQLDVNALFFYRGNLYSGSDDGFIKIWNEDLKKKAEHQAHEGSVYSLTANENILYSSSNDGCIKSWNAETLEPLNIILKDPLAEIWKVAYSPSINSLFSGDGEGNIRVYKEDKFYGAFNLAEPVKDLLLDGNIIFTSKDLDLIVTEVLLDGEKIQFGTKQVFDGRAPITSAGDKLCFSSRDGKDIIVHEKSEDKEFKRIAVVKGAHEMIINALAGLKIGNDTYVYSGGWDKVVKKWKIEGGDIKPCGNVSLDFVVNSLATGSKGEVYVGGDGGQVLRIDA